MKRLKRVMNKIKRGAESGLLAIALTFSPSCGDELTINNNVAVGGGNGNSAHEQGYTCESGYAAYRNCYFMRATCFGSGSDWECNSHNGDDDYIDRAKERIINYCNWELEQGRGQPWVDTMFGCLEAACAGFGTDPVDYPDYDEQRDACFDQYWDFEAYHRTFDHF